LCTKRAANRGKELSNQIIKPELPRTSRMATDKTLRGLTEFLLLFG